MKILHLFGWDKKFVPSFINFVQEHFSDGQHEFIVFGHVDDRSSLSSDAAVYPRVLKKFFPLSHSMRHADKIILHGLFNNHLVYALALQPWLLKKCYWVIWGGDLYRHVLREKDWRYHKDELFRRFVIKRIGYLVTYIPGDVELARKWYGAKGKYVECIMYPSNVFTAPPKRERRSALKTILVGNSADPSNNHEFILQKLAKQNLDGWRIVTPLSYGDKVHAAKIIKLGRKLFGNKFEPLTELLPYNDYLQLLSEIDIAVFAHNRQQAMGNTITLLGMGKTVYMKTNVSSAKHLLALGICLFDVHQLELKKDKDLRYIKNEKIVREIFSVKKLILQWASIFGK